MRLKSLSLARPSFAKLLELTRPTADLWHAASHLSFVTAMEQGCSFSGAISATGVNNYNCEGLVVRRNRMIGSRHAESHCANRSDT
jgi:hypothetical protein